MQPIWMAIYCIIAAILALSGVLAWLIFKPNNRRRTDAATTKDETLTESEADGLLDNLDLKLGDNGHGSNRRNRHPADFKPARRRDEIQP